MNDENWCKERFDEMHKEKTLLQNPKLFSFIVDALHKEVIGEVASLKAIFLSLCSIWVKNCSIPLNTLVSAESSAGKSFICKKITKLFPPELVEYRTKITPEAFTYWHNEPDWDWTGKICYLEDVSQNLLDSPTFKLMASEGSIATIVIKQKAVDIKINGKPCLLLTSARTNPNTEILNRFQIASLDESQEQTRKIILKIGLNSTGLGLQNNYSDITSALKLLQRKNVIIPYGELVSNFITQNTNSEFIRLRRDISRLLDLVKCSAVLHQYQRKNINEDTIEANEDDYEIARECINYISTQTFRGLTHRLKRAFDCCKSLGEFSAREIHSKYPFMNLKNWYNNLDKLCEINLLRTEIRKIEDTPKPTTFFICNFENNYDLPKFSELNLLNLATNTAITTNTTNTTISTNTPVKEESNCRNCHNYHEKASEDALIDNTPIKIFDKRVVK